MSIVLHEVEEFTPFINKYKKLNRKENVQSYYKLTSENEEIGLIATSVVISQSNLLISKHVFNERNKIVDIIPHVNFPCYSDDKYLCVCFRKKILFSGDKSFEIPLEKPVVKVYKLPFEKGLIFQINKPPKEKNTVSFYTMVHPLEDLVPVECESDVLGINCKIIYLNENFPICLIYNGDRKCYVLYEIRFLQQKKPEGVKNFFKLSKILELDEKREKILTVECVYYKDATDFIIYFLSKNNSLYCFVNPTKNFKMNNVRSIISVAEDEFVGGRVLISLSKTGDSFSVYFRQFILFNFRIRSPTGNDAQSIPLITELRDSIKDTFYFVVKSKKIFKVSISSSIFPKSQKIRDFFKVIKFVVPFNLYSTLFYDYLNHYYLNKNKIKLEWEILIHLFTSLLYKSSSSLSKIEGRSGEDKIEIRVNREILKTKTNLLCNHIGDILFVTHLLYENYKLTVLTKDSLYQVSKFLSILSFFMGWTQYIDFYRRDHPTLLSTLSKVLPVNKVEKKWKFKEGGQGGQRIFFSKNFNSSTPPPSIYEYLMCTLEGKKMAYPIISNNKVVENSRKICRLFHVFSFKSDVFGFKSSSGSVKGIDSPLERVLYVLIDEKLKKNEIGIFQSGISIFLKDCLLLKRNDSDRMSKIREEGYRLIDRKDLAKLVCAKPRASGEFGVPSKKRGLGEQELWKYFDFDDKRKKPDHILDAEKYFKDIKRWKRSERYLGYRVFSQDRRLDEAWDLLSNTKTLIIPENYKEIVGGYGSLEQKLLILIFSLSISRGMIHLCSKTMTIADTLRFPSICLKAKIKQEKTYRSIDLIRFLPENENESENIKKWPKFHLAVSETLSIIHEDDQAHQQLITREWIRFHRKEKATIQHAGMLLGLGILRHLTPLTRNDIYSYLSAQHDLTTLSLLLGVAANNIGTQDSMTTKIISIHINSLSPNRMVQISCNVQTGALVAMGYLYLSSSHRFFSEVLFSEIVKPPRDDWGNRESYSLAAGFGFGLINLGRGTSNGPPETLKDMNIDENLFRFLEGGKFPNELYDFIPQNFNQKSLLILQKKDEVSVAITAPGACMALSMMYLMSNNSKIAQRMMVPDTKYELKSIIPDIALLRLIGASLVMWDYISPTEQWIESRIPKACKETLKKLEPLKNKDKFKKKIWLVNISAYCYSGCCFVLGLKFAGSGREDILKLMIKYYKKIKKFSTDFPTEKISHDYCLAICLVSMSCVMAGRGRYEIVKLCEDVRNDQAGNFSSQFSISMALGINFLGGGRYTLKTTPLAVVSLLISLYPKFPSTIVDNKFHLQALRHLYVLASETRLLEAIDVRSSSPCYVPIQIVVAVPKSKDIILRTSQKTGTSSEMEDISDSSDGETMRPEEEEEEEYTYNLTLPCLIPERTHIKRMKITSPRYYNIDLRVSGTISSILDKLTFYVKKKSSFKPTITREDVILSPKDIPKNNITVLGKGNLDYFKNEKNNHLFILKTFLPKSYLHNFKRENLLYKSLKDDQSDLIFHNLYVENGLKNVDDNLELNNLLLLLKFYDKKRGEGGTTLDGMDVEYIRTKIDIYFKNFNFLKEFENYVKNGDVKSRQFSSFLVRNRIPDWKILRRALLLVKKRISGGKLKAMPFIIQTFPKASFQMIMLVNKILQQKKI